MKKLKLNVDDLAVNSFDVAPVEESRGTVQGAADATGNCSQYCGFTYLKWLTSTWMEEKQQTNV